MRKRVPQSALGDLLRARFAANIRRLRKEQAMTQSGLASASGLGRPFICQVERGHCSVTLETIGAIANALGVRPAALISAEPPASANDGAIKTERDEASGRMRAGKHG